MGTDAETWRDRYYGLLYRLSHDMGAPVRHLNFGVKVLSDAQKDGSDDATEKGLRFIVDSIERLEQQLTLIRAISSAVRPGRAVPSTQVSPLLTEALSQSGLPEAQLHVPAELPPIGGCPSQFVEVCTHLFDNIHVHCDPKSEGTISAEPAGEFVKFRLEDNGPGMSKSIAEGAFEPFVGRGGGRDSNTAGGGLGLVRALVEAHGGHVTIVRSDSSGTIVEWLWPASDGTPPMDESSTQ